MLSIVATRLLFKNVTPNQGAWTFFSVALFGAVFSTLELI